MGNKGNYEYPAWCQMETALDSYEQDRAAYLERKADGLGPTGRERLERFNKAADSLLKGVQNLAGVDGIACLQDLAEASNFQKDKPFELLDEHVCITFGWEVMGMLSFARSRFLELLLLLKDRRPCDRAKAFLQRVARCYLFGFDAECVVMCRAVLDREFEAEVPGDDVEDWWAWYKTTQEGQKDKRKNAQHNLWGRIRTALFKQRLADNEFDAADTVRERANRAVHRRPDSGEALEAVKQTIQALDGLAR
jgi:hypothetical protein